MRTARARTSVEKRFPGFPFSIAYLPSFWLSGKPGLVQNIATGLATTEPDLEDVLKTLGASKSEILWNVGLPRTMPYFFASLKVAITLSFVGAVLSETVASNRGIGNVMMTASSNFQVSLVFAGLIILAVLGVVLYALFSWLERRVTGWATRDTEIAIT
jgi:NitT/TauT family transport system permease protein